jgi:CRP-like cAMP-binding protein
MQTPKREPIRHLRLVLRSLSRFGQSTVPDEKQLSGRIEQSEIFRPEQEIVSEGSLPERIHIILSGWFGRTRTSSDGRRQIFQLVLPGELVGTAFGPALYSTVALTPALAASLPTPSVVPPDKPELHMAATVAGFLRLEESFFLNQLTRTGQLSAFERIGHLLLELEQRLAAVGLVHGDSFLLPLTQEHLADLLGLSSVHVNRTLQQLRREGLAEAKAGIITIIDKARLAERCRYCTPAVPF